MDNIELVQDFLDIYNSNRNFTQQEIEEFYDCFDMWNLVVERVFGKKKRWTCPVSYICKVEDKYFSFDRHEGLTEFQENEEWEQPYEVIPIEVKKTVWSRL